MGQSLLYGEGSSHESWRSVPSRCSGGLYGYCVCAATRDHVVKKIVGDHCVRSSCVDYLAHTEGTRIRWLSSMTAGGHRYRRRLGPHAASA
ncbi:hypothetical protein GCM10022222_51170 [Amycolatopsis ultiminotia]|uniref:Uncharacterized protein n=1 Tax=Amycolatopsis ultiminotia TaxID=543629 RepID=A0ABP6X463_9PSEU